MHAFIIMYELNEKIHLQKQNKLTQVGGKTLHCKEINF